MDTGARNCGLTAETLFVGATRPPMRWGVTYAALLCNLVFTLELFLLSRNLLALLMCFPIHGVCALLCLRDAHCFELILLWGRTRLPGLLANRGYWHAATYSPLSLGARVRRRRADPCPQIWSPVRTRP